MSRIRSSSLFNFVHFSVYLLTFNAGHRTSFTYIILILVFHPEGKGRPILLVLLVRSDERPPRQFIGEVGPIFLKFYRSYEQKYLTHINGYLRRLLYTMSFYKDGLFIFSMKICQSWYLIMLLYDHSLVSGPKLDVQRFVYQNRCYKQIGETWRERRTVFTLTMIYGRSYGLSFSCRYHILYLSEYQILRFRQSLWTVPEINLLGSGDVKET